MTVTCDGPSVASVCEYGHKLRYANSVSPRPRTSDASTPIRRDLTIVDPRARRAVRRGHTAASARSRTRAPQAPSAYAGLGVATSALVSTSSLATALTSFSSVRFDAAALSVIWQREESEGVSK